MVLRECVNGMRINGREFKAAILDIDGVLIDAMPIWNDLGVRYLRAQGIEPEPELESILFNMTIADGVTYMHDHYHLQVDEPTLHDGLIRELSRFYCNEVPLKPGARELVMRLHEAGIPTALATVGDRGLETAALTRLGIREYLGEMMQADELHTTKKETCIYDVCAEHLGYRPEEILVIEDVLEAVETSVRGGYITLAVYDAASRADFAAMRETADIAVRTLEDLTYTA